MVKHSWLSWSSGMFILLLICSIGAGCTLVSTPEIQTDTMKGGADGKNKIVLTVWHDWMGQDSTSETMRKLLERFQKDNPHVELRAQPIIRDVYRSRLKTMASAGELPDVFLIWPDSMTREFVRGGLIQPIDDLLKAKPEWTAGFMPRSFDSFTVDGSKYSVPMSMAPSSFIFYNQAIFDQYGVKVPETWDELLSAIRIFNRQGIIPIALGNKSSWVAQSAIFSTLANRVTGTGWFMDVLGQNGARFTDPIFVNALSRMQELAKAQAFQSNFNYIDHIQMEQLYYQKQAAMFIDGGSAVSNLIAGAPKDVLETTHITLFPTVAGGKGLPLSTSGVVGNGFAVNRQLQGEQREAAFKLIYTLSDREAQRSILNSNTLVSYQLEVDRKKAHPLFVELHQLTNKVTLLPAYETQLTTAAVEALSNGIQELLKGGSPDELAKKLQDTQANVLGKFR
ncbi:extracellular solute-binding protein [Paenibacillus radicis (ex Xue et al. 2023)]|uniref:Extracellular solute-binding protein n=1 Tax=Paenibacillus radicis (ex Xue et al. 2023) TaxID=2972489 RepID=A0ABT1YCI2_9BACL|nr:extracellular solute-binding protein [Paenibacillus radicis (ex Xue et al. 2023)]MCR8630910.1 extracellular solute-binding protein [Paenibacillus radicis (ex Xue et al. 2023)]